ncbi:MAG: hypothetical protein M3276_08230 [Actinomycetota bacterium]|nr:hypothetical protein [Actinomycetota bacterium]
MVQVDAALILAASALEEHHQLSFGDALIIEAARRAGRGGWNPRTCRPVGGSPCW